MDRTIGLTVPQPCWRDGECRSVARTMEAVMHRVAFAVLKPNPFFLLRLLVTTLPLG
jgi:hypothetical protein